MSPVIEKPSADSPDAERLLRLRHSCSHLLAEAVLKLWPETQLAIGPPIAEGFYYDFDAPTTFNDEDLERIEAVMRELAKQDAEFERIEVSRGEAREILEDIGQTEYKFELLEDIPEGEDITFYRDGDFIDLCAGPHVDNKNQCRHFELQRVSSAYWRGDEDREQLQRIYGTAFYTEDELEDFLEKQEQAEERKHQKLGNELDLFESYEMAGPGLYFFKPRGATIRRELEDWHAEMHREHGYEPLQTPHILKSDAWQTSGHLENYRENMFAVQPYAEEGAEDDEADMGEYGLKPMNCPGHIMVYDSEQRSYRDLPVRYWEFGDVYRYERSGTLNGLLRVRGFTQDDAHIFCTPEQYKDEIKGVLDFISETLDTFEFEYYIELATRPDNSMGTDEQWEHAQGGLREVLQEEDLPFTVKEGDGTFYGPKIDFYVLDALDREWQISTVQLDFQLPQRFGISYIDEHDEEREPIMIHRAIFGSFERFFALLTEHFGGAFPLWLAPEQVVVCPVNDSVLDYCHEVREKLEEEGIRASVDESGESLGKQIRDHTVRKVPYLFIIGPDEQEAGTVSPRSYFEGDLDEMPLEEALEILREEIAAKRCRFK